MPSTRHRFLKAIVVIGVSSIVLSLAACTPVGVDQGAAQEWLTKVSAEREAIEGLLGTAAGYTSPETPKTEGDDIGITLTAGTPVTASKIEVLCFGGLQAQVHIMVTTSTSGYGLETEVLCDGSAHSVDLGTNGAPLQGVKSARVDVRTSSPTTYYVDVYL